MSVCDWLMTRILISDWRSWDEAGFSWIEAVYTFRQHGYSTDYLIDFSIVTDSKNSSWRVIDIDQVNLLPCRDTDTISDGVGSALMNAGNMIDGSSK